MVFRLTVSGSRFTVDDNGIDQLFATGQEVWKYTALMGTEHLGASIMYAPSRSGRLRASHYPVPIMTPEGRRGWRYTIRNDAPYARFVHEGTTGPIYPTGEFLSVPVFRGSVYPRFRARSVSGQIGKPWMQWALDSIT